MVFDSTHTPQNSCPVSETFDQKNLTSYAGANLIIDFARDVLQLRAQLDNITLSKGPGALYSLSTDLEALIVSYALGIERISHIEDIEADPLLCLKLGQTKLPDTTTLYRSLDRFDTEEHIKQLADVNTHLLEHLLQGRKSVILDIDTTVETVHGQQEGTCVGYNPRYHGRASYQPFFAFDSQSGATVHSKLRSGKTPSGDEVIEFYKEAKAQLPKGTKVRFVRGDRGMTSGKVCDQLEKDNVSYTLKIKMNSSLYDRISRGVLWKRLYSNDDQVVIEAGSVRYKAKSWDRHRRIVFIRSRPKFTAQQMLFAEYSWHYEAIVTDLNWEAEDIWHFYNQRCTCENHIKELKDGVHIDAISKAGFYPNAADLLLKVIAYNVLLAFRGIAPTEYNVYGITRFRRVLLRIPGVLVHHARKWTLRLPSYWRHAEAWQCIRSTIQQVNTSLLPV
ncbi:MAG TPA: IS1380 family transposase [Firmicutes bacterium]|jgi:hypothetical protein|nr:IS1380 family transposase [Bacillota bacterium]